MFGLRDVCRSEIHEALTADADFCLMLIKIFLILDQFTALSYRLAAEANHRCI